MHETQTVLQTETEVEVDWGKDLPFGEVRDGGNGEKGGGVVGVGRGKITVCCGGGGEAGFGREEEEMSGYLRVDGR